MTRINHQKVLEMVINQYEEKHGEPGLEKADVDALVYGLGGNKGDIYKVMVLGMERFFGEIMKQEQFLS